MIRKTRRASPKILSYLLTSALLLTMLPGGLLLSPRLKASAASIQTALDISQGSITIGNGAVSGYDSSGNPVTAANENGYVITGTTAVNTVTVASTLVNVTLDTVSIQMNRSGCAFSVVSGTAANITLLGNNTLSSNGYAGLGVPQGAAVTIGGSGSLTVTGDSGSAGIGGSQNDGACGMVTITGATVTAKGSYGAGIGGGTKSDGGTVTVSGGTVTATSINYGAGIGGGFNGGNGGSVTVTGGTVTANGTAAGIGAGLNGNGGNVTITGGTINASSVSYSPLGNSHLDQKGCGAGIGGSSSGIGGGAGGSVMISNGKVTAVGSGGAAGIGSSSNNAGAAAGNLTVTGGTVTATGSGGGAGIGGGNGNDGGTVTISGGLVKANGDPDTGAGIGGGAGGSSGTVTISDGTVLPTGYSDIGPGCNGPKTRKAVITGGSVNSSWLNGLAGTTDGNGNAMVMIEIHSGFSAGSSAYVSINDGKVSSLVADDNGYFYLWCPKNTSGRVFLCQNSCFYGAAFSSGSSVATSMVHSLTPLSTRTGNVVISGNASDFSAKKPDGSAASPDPIGYYITQTGGSSTSNTITVKDGSPYIVLYGVNISSVGSAVTVAPGASPTIILYNNNTLIGTGGGAGIEVASGAAISINGPSSLTVGGYDGIGGSKNSGACGVVNIIGGTVTARGENGGQGIDGTINIYGGSVVTDVINSTKGKVTITGGTITSQGENSSLDIDTGKNVEISGGSLWTPGQIRNQLGEKGDGKVPVSITLPVAGVQNVTSLSIAQANRETRRYGTNDMHTDANGRFFIWVVPDDPKVQGETVVNLVAGGKSYMYCGHLYWESLSATQYIPLRMEMVPTLAVYGTYAYGSAVSPTVASAGTPSWQFTGHDNITGAAYSSTVPPTNAGDYSCSFTEAAENDVYYAYKGSSISKSFSIVPRSLSFVFSLTLPNGPVCAFSQTSNATPAVVVKSADGNTLDPSNYTVSYANNWAIASSTDSNPPIVTVIGHGNCFGTLSAAFTIETLPTLLTTCSNAVWDTSQSISVHITQGTTPLQSVTMTHSGQTTDLYPQLHRSAHGDSSGNRYIDYDGIINVTDEGSYTISATDEAGYVTTSTVEVSHIDANPPDLYIYQTNTPAAGSYAAYDALRFVVNPYYSDIKSLTVSYSDGAENKTETLALTANPNVGHQYFAYYTANLPTTYTFVAKSVSGATTTKTYTPTDIDATPGLQVAARSNGSPYASGNWAAGPVTFTLTDTVQNPGNITYQYSTDDGANWIDISQGTCSTNGSITVSSQGTVKFRIKSAMGYFSNVVPYTVKIDTTAPDNVSIAFSNNPFRAVLHFLTFHYFFNNTVTASFSASDTGSGVDHYEYQLVAPGAQISDSGWITGSSVSISPEYKGTVYTRSVDEMNNISGTVSKSLAVDQTAPTVTANHGDVRFTTTDPNASIPVTVTDNGAGVGTVAYQVNGATHTVDVTQINYDDVTDTYSFNIGSLPNGSYDVVISAQDNSGNNASPVTLHVTQNTMPTVTGISLTPGSATVSHGGAQAFTANVSGTNLDAASSAVTWSVSGSRSSATGISSNGILTVAPEETATSLTVTAASVSNAAEQAQAAVTVRTSSQTGFAFSVSSIDKIYGDKDFPISASGGQGNGAVSYVVANGADIISLNGNSVSAKRAGTAVVTATKAADGSFNPATDMLTIHVGRAVSRVMTLPTAYQLFAAGPLSGAALAGGSASVPGSFAWTTPNTNVSSSGSYSVTFTPADTTNYTTAACMVPVTLETQVTDSHTGVTIDLGNCTLPPAVTSVSVESSAQSAKSDDPAYTIVLKLIENDQTIGSLQQLTVYSVELLDQNGNPVTKITGQIKVKVPIPDGMNGDPHIYWYDSAGNKLVDMKATREGGYLAFYTSHFSFYAVAQLGASSTPVSNFKTGSDDWPLIPWAALGSSSAAMIICMKRRKGFMRKINKV